MRLEMHSGIFNISSNPSNTDIEIVKNTVKKMQEYDASIVVGGEGEVDEYFLTCSYANSTQAEIKELYKDCK